MLPPAIRRHVPHTEANGRESQQHGTEVSAVHAAICDNCNERIVGIRYKCGSCANYDMVRASILIFSQSAKVM